MSVSVFDLFKIGIGPSSSHTVGPMIAARQFACHVRSALGLAAVHHVTVELFGSLSATGVGHGTDTAVLLGLAGHEPDHIDPDQIAPTIADIRTRQSMRLLGEHTVPFVEKEHLLFRRKGLPQHPNGMVFHAFDAQGRATGKLLGGIGPQLRVPGRGQINPDQIIRHIIRWNMMVFIDQLGQ